MMMIIDQWTMVSWWAGSLRPLTFLPASYPRLPPAGYWPAVNLPPSAISHWSEAV